MNIALFGGTFDPIHTGHIQAAKVAARKFRLDRILFVPSGKPPHKLPDCLTPFAHRYAMVALACVADRRFLPSLLEAPKPGGRPHYSIETVRAARRSLNPKDNLFFLIGADAFLDLPHWRQHRRLLDLVNFIVVSRPGYSRGQILNALPPGALPSPPRGGQSGALRLRHSTLQILEGVDVPIAARDIRRAIRAGRRVTGLVPPLVEQYIRKEGIYRPGLPGPIR